MTENLKRRTVQVEQESWEYNNMAQTIPSTKVKNIAGKQYIHEN